MYNIPAEFFDDAPGELDLFARGDMQKAEYAHYRGDPCALFETVIHCLPPWAVPDALQAMKPSRVNPRVQAAHNTRAAALHAAEDFLGFGFGYSTTGIEVATVAEALLRSPRFALDISESSTFRRTLKKWWFGDNEKNRRKYSEPDFSLMGDFYKALGIPYNRTKVQHICS